MSEDWKIGDLAMLVISGPKQCPKQPEVAFIHRGTDCPPMGSIREVTSIHDSECDSASPGFVFQVGDKCGCYNLHFDDGSAATYWRCVKVTPEEDDEFDREIIELYKMEPEFV